MVSVSMTVNGKAAKGEVEDRTLLVDFIRGNLGLTGTHVGCDTSQCGACVVHFNGDSVKSCTILAVQAEGAKVTTIEGLAQGATLHPMQAAFREPHGLQCGFCTPGMIMSARPAAEATRAPASTRCASGWRGISAAARATTISSRRSWRAAATAGPPSGGRVRDDDG